MKKRVKQLMALGLAAMLVLGGCGEKEEPIIVEPVEEVVETVEPEEEAEEVVEEEIVPLSVNVKTNNETYYLEGEEEAYLYLQYCDVNVNGDNYENLKRNVEKWSAERSKGLKSLYTDFQETAEGDEQEEMFYGYSLYQTITTARADERVLSFRDDTYQNTGGAHGMFYREGINFDSQSGKHLGLRDVVSDWENFSTEATACVVYYLKESYGEELFDDYVTSVEAMWAEETEPVWYFDASSIVIVIPEYLVGPYSIGTPEIHLSYVDFGHYIKDEYLPESEYCVAILQENQELYLKLPGIYEEVPMMLQYEWVDEVLNCSLWLGENERQLGYFDVLEDAYIVKNGIDVYCLVEVDMASDDYVTYVYRLTDGVIEEVSMIGASIDQGNINSEEIRMESWVYLLGTYGGMKNYHFDKNRKLITEDEEYQLLNNSYVLKTTVDLPVVLDETESILPADSQIILTATDGETYVKFMVQETGQAGTLYVQRGESEDYHVSVNGMDETECFEFLPYAG